MKSVGDSLRLARQDKGLEIADLAASLKINPKYLTAIEQNQLADLPGTFFYRSFVQQYAQALNFDCTDINSELDRILGSRPAPPIPGQDGAPLPVRLPNQNGYSKKRSLASSFVGLALVLAGCTGIYALWFNWQQVSVVVASVVSRVTKTNVNPLPALPLPSPAHPKAAHSPAMVASQPEPQPVVSTAPAPNTGHLLLRLTATEATWVSVVADGKTVYVGVLQPSESRSIDGKFAKLVTGNAGGLSVEFNGKRIAVGDRGQVRVVTFSPDTFQVDGTPVSAPPPHVL